MLVVIGWITRSLVLTVLAPIVLVGVLAPFALYQGPRRFDPFEPIWLCSAAFAFAYLLVPGLTIVKPASFVSLPGYEDFPPAQYRLACLVAALAFLGFIAGYRVASSRGAGRATVDRSGSRARPRVALALAVSLFLIGSVTVALAVRDSGVSPTPGALFSGRLRHGIVTHFSGQGFLTVGFMLLMLAPAVLTLWAAHARRAAGWWMVAAMAAVAAIELAGLAGSRIGVLAIVVGCFVVAHYRFRRFPVKVLLGAAVALAFIGVLQAVVRGTAQLNNPLAPVGTLSSTLDGFGQLVNALARVHSFQFGRTLVEDLGITYLPRAIWPHKPLIYGFVRAQQQVMPGLFADFGNGKIATFPVGLVAEGYVNFAIFGAVGLPMAAGALLRRLYDALQRTGSDWILLILAWTLGNVVSLMRGFATTVLTVVVGAIFLSPLLLSERLSRRRTQSVSPLAPDCRAPTQSAVQRAANGANVQA